MGRQVSAGQGAEPEFQTFKREAVALRADDGSEVAEVHQRIDEAKRSPAVERRACRDLRQRELGNGWIERSDYPERLGDRLHGALGVNGHQLLRALVRN